MTYSSVKESLVQYVQRTYKWGQDIAKSLRDETVINLDPMAPVRKFSSETDAEKKRLDQEGLDLLYIAEVSRFIERKEALEVNLTKAYTLIFSTYCNRHD